MGNKVLFKVKCVHNDGMSWFTNGSIYNYYETGLIDDLGRSIMGNYQSFEKLSEEIRGVWELVEETLLDKFYNLLGVEDMEEFKIEHCGTTLFKFERGIFYFKFEDTDWKHSSVTTLANIINGTSKIIKLPPKPQFTEEEKEQIKHIYGLFGECWVARDKTIRLWVFTVRPEKGSDMWDFEDGSEFYYELVETILPSIKWEDAEPFHVEEGCWL